MRCWCLSIVLGCTSLALLAGSGASQQKTEEPGQKKYAAPENQPPDAATLKQIKEKTHILGQILSGLRKQGVPDSLLIDIEVYHRAAESIVQLEEFYHKNSAAWTLDALDRGILRARMIAPAGAPWMSLVGQTVVFGYRSRIDGTVQPLAVTYPASYGKDPHKKWRVDIVLHGRNPGLTEVQFLHDHDTTREVPVEQEFVKVDVYGRGNNAYRWAGETDVFEAIEAFLLQEGRANRGQLIDPRRFVLRGFSMGGAGTWHLGLHFPSRWCVIGPGAGFTTTHGYTRLPELAPFQEACLSIYDAIDYAENVFNVPVVAYSGAKDPQKKAADNIEKRVQELGLSQKMKHLIAPDLEHKFPQEWFKKADALYAKYAAVDRPEYPEQVRFVTYTLKYPSCDWVEVLALEKHYNKAEVKAQHLEGGFKVQTQNVRALHLILPKSEKEPQELAIDGEKLLARPAVVEGTYHLYLEKKAGHWQVIWPQRLLTERGRRPQKVHNLQGPIDDAFSDRFLCVRGTGKPWHGEVQEAIDARLKRFRADWARHWRGTLPIKDDVDVTNEDVAGAHLILFGDPGSNTLVAQVLDGLPLEWTKEEITLVGKKYAAAQHIPVLIYPNPLNAGRYVVLNSGHTIPGADYTKTNALLYPRLGDYAILRLGAAPEVADAGLFDEYWQVGGSPQRR
jgi:hypothetical protein